MNENERNDALDSILDSINMDDTMEKKIDDFARNKQRLRRIERARQNSRQFQEAYGKSSENQVPETGTQAAAGTVNRAGIPSYGEPGPHTRLHEAAGSEEPVQSGLPGQEPNIYEQQPASYEQPASEETLGQTAVNPGGMHGPAAAYSENPENEIGNTITAGQGLGGTRVFSQQDVPEAGEEYDNQTRNMSPEEIQDLLEEDDRPILRREYISDHEEEMEERPVRTVRKKKKKKMSWKLPAAIAAIAMLGLIAFGIFSFGGFSSPDKPTDTQTRSFERLKNWAEQYASYSDDEKEQIKSFSNVYNKLTDDQKREINKILEGITGKTFDQLLANADSEEKPDNKENITGKAEKKAALKADLEALKSQLSSSQSSLDNANATYRTNQTNMDNMQGSLDQAKSNLDEWKGKVESLQNTATEQKGIMDKQGSAVTELQRQIDELNGQETPDPAELSELQGKLSEAQKAYDDAKAKYDAANLDLPGAQNNLQKAQSSYDSLSADYESYKTARDNASGLIDQLTAEVQGLQNSINETQAKIDALK